MWTVEQTACRFLCQLCYVDNTLLVKMQRVADCLSGFHCNIAVMTENEGDPATLTSLTLRLLMSCIYMEHLFLMFLDHTQRRSTVGRTPLDE